MIRRAVCGALHDTALSAVIGLLAAVGLSALLFAVGFLVNGWTVRGGLIAVRGGLLIVGAAILFIAAGVLLWARGAVRVLDNTRWKRRFRVFGLVPVLLIVAALLLVTGSALDYALYF